MATLLAVACGTRPTSITPRCLSVLRQVAACLRRLLARNYLWSPDLTDPNARAPLTNILRCLLPST